MTIGTIISIFLLIVVGICFTPILLRRYWWKKDVYHLYTSKTNIELNHNDHKQKVRLWLHSKQAKDYYINYGLKEFNNMYNTQVSVIGDELIEELREKYENEYKSRNTQNTKSI